MSARFLTGFEMGTAAGFATGTAVTKFCDYIAGTPAVVSTSPKNGTYCLEISQSGAVEAVGFDTNTIGTNQTRGYAHFYVYFPTSLPAADVHLFLWFVNAGGTASVTFNSGTSKLAVRYDAGTETDGPSVVANTWYRVECYFDVSANPHTFDWWVDGVAQTRITDATAASTLVGCEVADSATAQTMTARYDNLYIDCSTSAITGMPQIIKVEPLFVDTGGTVTLSGTTGNFNTFTNNGTLAAWNATTARNNIDEIPPTIGASADGFVQITAATTNYVEIPMTTYTLGGGETVLGASMKAVGWATSGTAATLGFRHWNGTTESTLIAGTVDPGFDASTTTPGWACAIIPTSVIDSQGEIDGTAFRVGFSSDSTPDVGIHAIIGELAILVPGGTNANAECATVTVSSPSASRSVSTNANVATATTSPPGGAPKVQPNAGNALITTTAEQPTIDTHSSNVDAHAGVATVTVQANSATGDVKATSGVATVSPTANSTTSSVKASSGVSTVTVSSPMTSESIQTHSGVSTVTTTAPTPTIKSIPSALPGVATVGVTANDTTGKVSTHADRALVTTTSNNPTTKVAPTPNTATVTTSSPSTTHSVKGSADRALVQVQANQSQVVIGTFAVAGVATVGVTANGPGGSVKASSGVSSITITAPNSSRSIGSTPSAVSVALSVDSTTRTAMTNTGPVTVGLSVPGGSPKIGVSPGFAPIGVETYDVHAGGDAEVFPTTATVGVTSNGAIPKFSRVANAGCSLVSVSVIRPKIRRKNALNISKTEDSVTIEKIEDGLTITKIQDDIVVRE